MTMVRQYPPQPPSQLHAPPTPYANLPPAPSHASYLRNAAAFEGRTLTQRHLPQQYAHPLSRHNSYTSQASDPSGSKPPEHMLRRKTPNGILAAAYDGTSVEHTEKPHATKHILLPVTAESSIPYGMKQDLPLRSSANAQHDGSSDWSPSLYFETGSGRTSQHLPQIDSMLNQIPPLQPLLPYQMYAQPYGGFMGPPGQSPLGPTVSNDQGPYGPYWPDGTYTPYQPAAMRDPRFLHPHRHHWTHPQHTNTFLGHTYNSAVPNMSNYPHTSFQFNQSSHGYPNFARPSYDYAAYPQPGQNYALDYQKQPLPPPPTQRSPDFLPSGQSTPIAEQFPATTPLTEYGPQSMNEQSREKVFAWAHTVYVDLLRYLQHTRKSQSHHSNGRAPARPHIYPKPPRQPGANLTESIKSGSSSRSLERRSSHSGPEAAKRPSISHSRSSSAWSVGGPENLPRRQTWQHMTQPQQMLPQVPGMEPARTLRRMSGSVANVHQPVRHEIPPSMTAASALEQLTKHCEESKWTWIDGILLGGCFAYALGDYQKAQEWYKHILSLDQE